jgi:hypothetical protein
MAPLTVNGGFRMAPMQENDCVKTSQTVYEFVRAIP